MLSGIWPKKKPPMTMGFSLAFPVHLLTVVALLSLNLLWPAIILMMVTSFSCLFQRKPRQGHLLSGAPFEIAMVSPISIRVRSWGFSFLAIAPICLLW